MVAILRRTIFHSARQKAARKMSGGAGGQAGAASLRTAGGPAAIDARRFGFIGGSIAAFQDHAAHHGSKVGLAAVEQGVELKESLGGVHVVAGQQADYALSGPGALASDVGLQCLGGGDARHGRRDGFCSGSRSRTSRRSGRGSALGLGLFIGIGGVSRKGRVRRCRGKESTQGKSTQSKATVCNDHGLFGPDNPKERRHVISVHTGGGFWQERGRAQRRFSRGALRSAHECIKCRICAPWRARVRAAADAGDASRGGKFRQLERDSDRETDFLS